jgi:hypothetical protein
VALDSRPYPLSASPAIRNKFGTVFTCV